MIEIFNSLLHMGFIQLLINRKIKELIDFNAIWKKIR